MELGPHSFTVSRWESSAVLLEMHYSPSFVGTCSRTDGTLRRGVNLIVRGFGYAMCLFVQIGMSRRDT